MTDSRDLRLLPPLVIVVLALALAPGARAGWNGLGGQLNADDRDGLAATSQLAGVAGTPWTIWTERPAGTFTYQVRAARWTGSAWSPTGPLNVDPGKDATSPSLTDVGGVPWAAWTELDQNVNGTRKIHVARWTGSAWVAVGGALADSRGSVPVVGSIGGVAHLVFADTDAETFVSRLRVMQWTGTAWADVGDAPVTTRPDAYFDLTASLADVGGVPFVAFVSGQELYVSRPVGGAWTQLGGSLRHAGTQDAREPSLTVLDGAPGVAWHEGTGSAADRNLRAARWNGSAWADLGGVIDTATYPVNLAPSLTTVDGAPWVAWSPGSVVAVSNFDGQQWTRVGRGLARAAGHTSDTPSLVQIAGVPHVGYTERFVTNDGGDSQSFHYGVFADRLLDDADTAHVSFASATAAAFEAAGDVTIAIRRTGGTAAPATVRYATADGSAGAADFTPASGTVAFAPGETEKTIVVALTADGAVEGPESFTVALSRPGGDTRLDAPATATVTIADDDAPDTRITAGPSGPTSTARPQFAFVASPLGSQERFDCWLDAAAPAPCSSPFLAGEALSEGAHRFRVRAVAADGLGDATPATADFLVDTVAPTERIRLEAVAGEGEQVGAGSTYAGAVRVVVEADDGEGSGIAELRCVLDPPSSPVTFADLPAGCDIATSARGEHVVYAAVRDRAGNPSVGVASATFTVLLRSTTVTIPGQANLLGAGHAAPPGPEPGLLPPSLPVTSAAGQVLTFSNVAGSVGCAGPPGTGPDGRCQTFVGTDISSAGGISGIRDANLGHNMYLVGVFLGAEEPLEPAPPRLDFSDEALGHEFTALAPAIGQSFFVGDGLAGAAPQRFAVPARATRLYLGFLDGFNFTGPPGYYGDNTGSLTAAVTFEPPAVPPVPPAPLAPAPTTPTPSPAAKATPRPAALTATAKGTVLTVAVPGPGVLQVAPASSRARAARATAPVFKAVKRTVTRAGRVSVALRLSAAAKRRLTRERRLGISARLTFTPSGRGAVATTRTRKLVLRVATAKRRASRGR